MALRPRWITDRARAALADTPDVAIVGPRQAGKSTLLVHLVRTSRDRWTSLTLDDVNVLERARNDPAGLLASAPGPMALDEVQRAPDLLLAIKASVDRDRRPGRFLLTGSADVSAMPRYGDALTGRIETVVLRPFSQGEIKGFREDFVAWAFADAPPPALGAAPVDLPERVVTGGFPPAAARTSPERRLAWFDAYWSACLQRDVHDVVGIARWTDLPRLARLVEEIPAWSTNAGKRVARRPKLLVSDTGLAAALLGMTAATWDADLPIATRGSLLESFVALELRKQLAWSATQATLHHFREHDGAEVDPLLEARDGRVVGIEVQAGHRVGVDAVRHLERQRDALGRRFVPGIALHAGTTAATLSERIWALPVSGLWTIAGEP